MKSIAALLALASTAAAFTPQSQSTVSWRKDDGHGRFGVLEKDFVDGNSFQIFLIGGG